MPIKTFNDGEQCDSVRAKLNSAITLVNQAVTKTDADANYASKTATQTALDAKADKATTDGELAKKADKTALTAGLNLKADKTALDSTNTRVTALEQGSGSGNGLTTEQGDARYIKKNGGGKIVSSYIDLDQDSGIRVVMTDDNDQDRGVTDVIGATDGMNGRIEIGSYQEGLTLNSKDKVKIYNHSTQRTTELVTDDMSNSKKNYVRSGTGTWVDIQPLLDAITGSGDGTAPDLSGYLTKDEAASEYLSQLIASSTYENKHEADAKYLSKTDATKTFLSKADASSEYLTPTQADAKYDVKPTGLQDGFLYARATNGYHPLPEIRKPVGVMHVDNAGHTTGQISDSYAINILSTENTNFSYQMDFTPKDGDIFVLINDGEKTDHNLNWALPSGTSIKGFHSFNLNPGYELWTKYVESAKEFIIFRENLSQVRGSFENSASNQGVTKEGTITRIVTKGTNADYDNATGVLTLDMTPPAIPEGGMTEAQADAKYVGKNGNQAINGELSVSVPNGVFSVRDNGDKVAIGLLHKDSITGEPAMIQTDSKDNLLDGRGDTILTTRSVPMPPASGAANQGGYALRVASGTGQYATWEKIPAIPDSYTKVEADDKFLTKTSLPAFTGTDDGAYTLNKSGDTKSWQRLTTTGSGGMTQADADARYLQKTGNQEVRNGSFRISNGNTHVRMVATGDVGYVQAGTDEGVQNFKFSGYNGKDLDSLDFQMKAGAIPTVGGHTIRTSEDTYSKVESDARYALKTDLPQGGGNTPAPALVITDETTTNGHTQEIDFDPMFFKTHAVENKPNAIAVSVHKAFTQNTLTLGYTSFFDRYSKFVGNWKEARGTVNSRIFPTDVHIYTGENAFIEADPVSKTFALKPFDDVLGTVNGVSEYMASFTINFKGKSKDTNLVTAYLWNDDEKDFVRTSTGAYMAVQTAYDKGQEMQPLQATGVISIPTARNLSWHIQATKPDLLEIAPLDVSGSGIMFQALTKNFKTGLALMEYMLMTRTDIKFTSIHLDKVIGSSHLAVEALSTTPAQTKARAHMQYNGNFQIDTLLPAAVYREGDAICIRQTDKQFSQQNRDFYTQYDLGFRLDEKQTTLLRDTEVTMKASILSKDRDHWWRAYTWTKDTPAPAQIITGLNEQTHEVVPIDGWVEVKKGMIPYDSRDDYRDVSFNVQVPSDSKGFSVLLMIRQEHGVNASSWFKNMTLEIQKPYTFYNIIIASNQIDPLHLSSFMALTKTFMPEELGRNFHSLTAVTEPLSVGNIESNSGLRCSVTREVPVGDEFSENSPAQSMLFKEGGLIKIQTSVYVRASEGLEKGRTAAFTLKWVRYYKENGKWKHEDVAGSERSSYVTGGDPVIHYQPFNPIEVNVGVGDALALVGTGSGSGHVELVNEGFNPYLQNRFWLVD